MTKLTLFKTLGVTTAAEAAALWPRTRVQFTTGALLSGTEPVNFIALLEYLNEVLVFESIRPGASAGRVGMVAEVAINHTGVAPGQISPLVLTALNKIAFLLQDTVPGKPIRLFITQAATGVEIVIESLPVEIRVPSDVLGPSQSEEEAAENPGNPADITLTSEPFRADLYDSLQVVLRDLGDSSIFVHLKVRMTEEGDFVVEPSVPISVGPCRFLGIPCKAIYDLNFVPSPDLGEGHQKDEQALEWLYHSVDLPDNFGPGGLITVRTVEFDYTLEPLKSILEKMNGTIADDANQVEFVLEDLAIPFGLGLPVPIHGRFGLRRKVVVGDNEMEAFDLSLAPIQLDSVLNLPSGWRLLIYRLLVSTAGEVTANMALVFGESNTGSLAATFNFTDDYLVQLGFLLPEAVQLFTLLGVKVQLAGGKLGLDIPAIWDKKKSWYETFQLLADFKLQTTGTGLANRLFKFVSDSEKPIDIYWHDFGYDRGEFAFGGLAFPKNVKFVIADIIHARIDEMGWITENNGGHYFFFSGGAPIFEAGDGDNAFAVKRLRIKVQGNESAPLWMLDGLSLSLKFGSVKIAGSGMIHEFDLDNHLYKETAFGVSAAFKALGKEFELAMQFLFGKVSGDVHNFDYRLFAFRLGVLPVGGGLEMYNLRMLYVDNMEPRLDAPDPDGQEMRVYKWYKQNLDALQLSDNRVLSAWRPKDQAMAFGVGAGVTSAGSRTILLDLFVFYHRSPEELGLLIGFEVFFGKSPKPIGFGVLDWDMARGKWGFILGLALTAENVLGNKAPGFLKNIGALTGSYYKGNKPGTDALGQLNDVASWLSLKIGPVFFFNLSILAAFCYQRVDLPNGPKGFGVIVSGKGGANLGIGKIQLYFEFSLISGIWRNESTASGFLMKFAVGMRIKVFWVLTVGIHVEVELNQLSVEPEPYRRLGALIKISTPWWLPDVSYRFDKVWNAPAVETTNLVSIPLISASAIAPGQRSEEMLAVTPLFGASLDEKAVYSIAQLAGAGDPTLPDQRIEQLKPVGVDSIIALNFKSSLDDSTSVGEQTPAGVGTEKPTPPAQGDLEARYELFSISIRRRPRFGTGAGVWTTLLAPEDTQIENLPDFPPGSDIEAHFQSHVSFLWDKDLIRDDNWDARRLLVNSRTPYTFISNNPEADETIVHENPGWPCCTGDGGKPTWHEVHFRDIPWGNRTPVVQRFSDSHSTLHWIGPRPPIVISGVAAPTGSHAARVSFEQRPEALFALVRFDAPVYRFELFAYWSRSHSNSAMIVQAYRGLKLVFEKSFPLALAGTNAPISITELHGITSVQLRFTPALDGESQETGNHTDVVEFTMLRYRTQQETLDEIIEDGKCHAQSEWALSGGGALAWLPNHDYEISVITRVTLRHTETEPQRVDVRQRAYFRTKGLIGLNAVAAVGDEVAPYVESIYPSPVLPILYGEEAVALAFDERFNVLLPVDRAPSPDNPAELNQLLEWALVVNKESSVLRPQRISQTSPDWIVTHRNVVTFPTPGPIVLNPTILLAKTRQITTLDPFRQRLETLVAAPFGCQSDGPNLHRSQVLQHKPYDPQAGEGAPHYWEANALYSVSVQRKGSENGPFVERDPFESNDRRAFTFADEDSASSTLWRSNDGVMRVDNSPQDGVRRYAVFGESDWNHLQVTVEVDPEGGAAGVAFGVAGLPAINRAVLVLIDQDEGVVRVQERRNSSVSDLESAVLPPALTAPYLLTVTAYDDQLEVQIGNVKLDIVRNDIREGRLALVAQNGGVFSRLLVKPVDAYRFQFRASRYKNFGEHIGSFAGEVRVIPHGVAGSPVESASTLFANTHIAIQQVMTPAADPAARQQLFDRWIGQLTLPLVRRTEKLEISRLVRNGGTDLLLLESPEPLPISTDVTLVLKKRAFTLPLPQKALRLPIRIRTLSVQIRFEDEEVVIGPVALNQTTQQLGMAQWLAHAVSNSSGAKESQLEYHIYALLPPVVKSGMIAVRGILHEIVESLPHKARAPMPWLVLLHGMEANEVALIDPNNLLLFDTFIPLNEESFVSVPVRVLTDGDERCALVMPLNAGGGALAPLPSGTYRLEFALDRVRYRSQTPDDESNYRAQASFTVQW